MIFKKILKRTILLRAYRECGRRIGHRNRVQMDWLGRLAGVRWIPSGSTRSLVLLIKYLVWETVHDNAFISKIGSESRSRRFSGSKRKPTARLEWFRRNFKFRWGTLRCRGEIAWDVESRIQETGDESRGAERVWVSAGRSSRRKLPPQWLIFLFRGTFH
jgi:hypothetical protein